MTIPNNLRIVSPSEYVALQIFLFYCSSFNSEKVKRLRVDVLQSMQERSDVRTGVMIVTCSVICRIVLYRYFNEYLLKKDWYFTTLAA